MAVNYTAADVVAIAKAELGYLEKASNASLDSKTANAGYNNYTKYAAYLDANTEMYNFAKNGFEWCDMFVDWCHVQASIAAGGTWRDAQTALCQPDKGCGAGCYYSYNYYKSAGRASSTPQVGAQIFFCSGSDITHTGLVYAFDATYVYTIEGNTSGASGVISNGGGVCAKSYYRNSANIYGYGLPKYASTSYAGTASASASTASVDHSPCVAKGMQRFTNSTGDDLPVYSSSIMDNKIGTLNPGESCYCFGKIWSNTANRWMWLVAYGLDAYPGDYKAGYVDDGGNTNFK